MLAFFRESCELRLRNRWRPPCKATICKRSSCLPHPLARNAKLFPMKAVCKYLHVKSLHNWRELIEHALADKQLIFYVNSCEQICSVYQQQDGGCIFINFRALIAKGPSKNSTGNKIFTHYLIPLGNFLIFGTRAFWALWRFCTRWH